MPNILDRTIDWFSPRTGFKRASARKASELLAGYDGAKLGRRTDGWITSGTDANTAIGMDLPRLRDRVRDLVRNTPEGKKIKRTILTHSVGTGIIPEADTGDDKLNSEINAAFQIHQNECDADGQLDYFGQQSQIVSGIIESGETLARRRSRLQKDGLYVPIQYQILESDHLDHTAVYNTHGGVTVMGVERDAVGRRVGYWLYPNHPGGAYGLNVRGGYQSKFYDAADVLHAYPKHEDRPGQERGVPMLSNIIMLMRDMDDYNDAEIVRAKIAACLSVLVEQAADPDTNPIGQVDAAASTAEERIEKLRPGTVRYLRPGEKAQPIIPAGHANFAEFARFQQHRQAMGAGLFFSQFTGDLAAVNWSSFRAGDRDFRAFIECLRWLCIIPMALDPMWRWFIDAAFLAGRISRIHYGVTWTPPQFISVNPLADAQADEADMANGALDFGEMNRRRGADPEKRYAEINRWQKRFDKDGVVLAWDRRKVSGSGVAQQQTGSEGVTK